jgi:hypothetical protein
MPVEDKAASSPGSHPQLITSDPAITSSTTTCTFKSDTSNRPDVAGNGDGGRGCCCCRRRLPHFGGSVPGSGGGDRQRLLLHIREGEGERGGPHRHRICHQLRHRQLLLQQRAAPATHKLLSEPGARRTTSSRRHPHTLRRTTTLIPTTADHVLKVRVLLSSSFRLPRCNGGGRERVPAAVRAVGGQ